MGAVIRAATRTVASFLESETGVEVDAVHSPADSISDGTALIHLYLFRVQVNPFFQNNPFVRTSPTELRAPPAAINLFYLITPYGADQQEIQLTLGDIIRVFSRFPTIPETAFHADLVGTTEELRVIPHPLSLEQLTDLWGSFPDRPYRVSLAYEVSTVLIESGETRSVIPVDERQLNVGVL